jgi:hypothetical protein
MAEGRGMIVRVMGATVVKKHCPDFLHLHSMLKRELTDIDFLAYSSFRSAMKSLFADLGYVPEERFNAYFGASREQYKDLANNRTADLFFDKLDMNHTIDFRGRLELDSPTITLADFLLEKMQIVRLNEKDKIDAVVVLREHQVGTSEKETVNSEYIAKLLAKDWGFYYTVATNLAKVRSYARANLPQEDSADVARKVDLLMERIDAEPKGTSWKLRARIGAKRKWYNDVEEVSG